MQKKFVWLLFWTTIRGTPTTFTLNWKKVFKHFSRMAGNGGCKPMLDCGVIKISSLCIT